MTNSLKVKCVLVSMVFLLGAAATLPTEGQTPQADAVTEYYVTRPDGTKEQKSRAVQTRRAAVLDPRQELLFTLDRILRDQASLGQNRNNNPIIADLERLLAQHSIKQKSTVAVTNLGPGTLEIRHDNGSYSDLQPGARTNVEIGTNKVQLTAIYQDTSIRLEHKRNGPVRFWDGDDRRFTTLNPDNRLNKWPPRTHRAHLTNGHLGYHLEQ